MKTPAIVRGQPGLEGSAVDLEWTLPPADDFAGGPPLAGVQVVRRESTYALEPGEGEVVYDGPPITDLRDRSLTPLRTYYYTVFAREGTGPSAEFHADAASRMAVFATGDFGTTRRLYELLPAVHQRLDAPLAPDQVAALRPDIAAAYAKLAPALRDMGQLERFVHTLGAPFDLMRSFAEGLPQMHDADAVRPDFMHLLASFVGWELDRTLPVYSQRNEIKFAPRLYRGVGTVPSLRSIVTRYTGWTAQAAESYERLMRSNHAPQLNVFAVAERGGDWRGADDAAALLGFDQGNAEASGAAGLPASLVTPAAGPFALRPDMQLSVTVDDRLPVVTRFRAGDFADIANAEAWEVATALNSVLTEATATARPDDRIELRSQTTGPDSLVRVDLYQTSLVTLEGAPRGAIAAVRESADRSRILYAAHDTMAEWRAREAGDALRGGLDGTAAGQPPRARPSQIRMKSFRAGAWSDSMPLGRDSGLPQRDPAAAALGGGRLLAAWIEGGEILWAQGTTRTPEPARVRGRRAEPFSIEPGTRLVIRGNWPEAIGFEFSATDLSSPAHATAAQVVTALNSRLGPLRAVAQPGGTIAIETKALGDAHRIVLDIEGSSAAVALGFDESNRSARGDWNDGVDWAAAGTLATPANGDPADLSMCPDGAGGAWLAFAAHQNGVWRVWLSHLTGGAWTAPEQVTDTAGGDREPAVAVDGSGLVWVVWSQRGASPSASPSAWSLRSRAYDPAGDSWSVQRAVTSQPPAGAVADREPSMIAMASGMLRVFFSSDRSGGPDSWWIEIDPATGTPGGALRVAGSAFADRSPAPLLVGAEPELWLLYRSDRSVSLSQVARTPVPVPDTRIATPPAPVDPPGPLRSVRLHDIGTAKRFANSTTAVPGDAARVSRMHRFDDPNAYTPQRTIPGFSEDDADMYTRGTVVLYLNRVVADNPLTTQKIKRLEAVLARFIPITTRVVVVLAPRVDIDYVYQHGADVGESYKDLYPFIEYGATGLAELHVGDSLPDWVLLKAAIPGPPPAGPATEAHKSVDPADLTSLRQRTFQSDLDPNRRWSHDDP